MPFVRRVTSKKWCTAVQNIEFNINISCILCLYFFVSSVQIQSPALYIIQALFLKISPPKKKKKNAWSQVTLKVKCEWWLAFVLHPISLFSFFCFDLQITRTFFDFPWRFYLEGSSIGFSGSGISLISGLGFGTLKQNRGGIRDKSTRGWWDVNNNPQDYGIP